MHHNIIASFCFLKSGWNHNLFILFTDIFYLVYLYLDLSKSTLIVGSKNRLRLILFKEKLFLYIKIQFVLFFNKDSICQNIFLNINIHHIKSPKQIYYK